MMTKLMLWLLPLIIGWSVWTETKPYLTNNTKKTYWIETLKNSWKLPLVVNLKWTDLYNMDDTTNKIDIRNHKYMNTVRNHIKEKESYRLEPYQLEYKGDMETKVKETFFTGGYGHKMLPGEVAPTDRAGWDMFFDKDFKKAMNGAYRLTKNSDMSPEAFGELTKMIYQMGETNISGWSNTLKYLREGNYEEAGREVLRGKSEGTVSKWSLQTPDRANETSEMLISLGNNSK